MTLWFVEIWEKWLGMKCGGILSDESREFMFSVINLEDGELNGFTNLIN